MDSSKSKLEYLIKKLGDLEKRQSFFQNEIQELRSEISKLYLKINSSSSEALDNTSITYTANESENPQISSSPLHESGSVKAPIRNFLPSDLERFIGENLISKIGIIITVLGVAIGAKYAIDHQLINPVTRIILGYLFSFVLLGFAYRLKSEYQNFSAVLFSGSIAIMYFITYSAYSFYSLIPSLLAFIIMILITSSCVLAAVKFDKQVIAHIGAVGAYAIPFLLSTGNENYSVLFTFIAIINIGILFIAVKKYWISLYYSSFIITWFIYASWYNAKYQTDLYFSLGLTFSFVFFIIFYITFLINKFRQNKGFAIHEISLLLINAFIFFGFGYSTLNYHKYWDGYLGLFALSNSLLHTLFAVLIYRKQLNDKNLFYFIAGLALSFLTISIPVELEGNWITVLWSIETLILFWIGRTKKVSFYENLSYPLMILSVISLFIDWSNNPQYSHKDISERVMPFLNMDFLSSIIVTASYGIIAYFHTELKTISSLFNTKYLYKATNILIPSLFFFVLYNTIRIDISNYFEMLYADSTIEIIQENLTNPLIIHNYAFQTYEMIWLINYTLLFLTGLSYLNMYRIKNNTFGIVNISLNKLSIIYFLIISLLYHSVLRDQFLGDHLSEYYTPTIFNVLQRYISYLFISLILNINYIYSKQSFLKVNLKIPAELLIAVSIIWMLSSEFINIMNLLHSSDSYKLGLSLLWGGYSLILVVLGIRKNKKFLRISAILLFTVTLLKLFFYDISHLETIPKTIIFIALGVLLLIISFIYNKNKKIFAEDKRNLPN